jgi:hypothetical protein
MMKQAGFFSSIILIKGVSTAKAGCQNGFAHASTPDVTSARRSAAL